MTAPILNTYNQTFTINQTGSAYVVDAVELSGFVQASLAIIAGPHAPSNVTVTVGMGKYSQLTLAQTIDTFPLSGTVQIRVYNVTGPEMSVVLQGPPNSSVPVQAWMYLR